MALLSGESKFVRFPQEFDRRIDSEFASNSRCVRPFEYAMPSPKATLCASSGLKCFLPRAIESTASTKTFGALASRR